MRDNTASASSEKAGAATHSTNMVAISAAVGPSTARLVATTEPNAETGSVRRARRKASAKDVPIARPQGAVCLTTTATGFGQNAKGARARNAPSMSKRLL